MLAGVPAGALRGQQIRRMHGHVSLSSGAPVAHAHVQVTVEEGLTAAARTDAAGFFSVVLSGPGNRFVVSADAGSSFSAARVLTASAGATELEVDLVLQVRVVALDPLSVRVPRLTVASATRWAPGSAEQSRLGITLERDPLDADPLSALTSEQTGVAQTPTPDGVGLSVAGQSPDQTRLTLDGSTLPGVVIP
ncbi:MAG: carboxypeptidase regulatory-like domain-containing protein, partial [Gemmatimonadetes bacterium]|nr:carboxypeptidase regulatory-like domain-containing protein [Gemmatimonadota bacterium]